MSFKFVLIFVVPLAAVFAQPAVVFTGGVRNAASARSGLPNVGVAPGAWFVVQGRNLGAPGSAVRSDAPTTSLGGTSVQVSAGGQQFDIPLLSVSSGEILGRLPVEAPVGDATLVVQAAGGASDPAKFTIPASSFGLLTVNQTDDASAMARDFFAGVTFNLNGLLNPAKPGDEVLLWGTGLGSPDAAVVEILIKGATAEITGKITGDNGLDLIRVRVPAGADGCGLPLATRTGGAVNPVGILSVAASGQACFDQNGFSVDDLAKAKANGGLNTAYLFLMRYGVAGGGAGGSFDIGFANFSRVSYDLMTSFRSNWAQTVPGACYAANTDSQGSFSTQGQPGADFFGEFYPFGETPLDAGPMVNVTGPGGPQQMQKVDTGLYSGFFLNFTNPLVSYFTPGDYTLSGSGGDTGDFSANVKIGPPVVWQNLPSGAFPGASVAFPRDQDLKLTWTGGNPGDRVWVVAYSAEVTDTTFVRAGVVSCYAQTQDGVLTVPASALQFLPANSMDGTGFIFLYSMAAPQRFQPTGGKLDAGYVLSLSYSATLANFK